MRCWTDTYSRTCFIRWHSVIGSHSFVCPSACWRRTLIFHISAAESRTDGLSLYLNFHREHFFAEQFLLCFWQPANLVRWQRLCRNQPDLLVTIHLLILNLGRQIVAAAHDIFSHFTGISFYLVCVWLRCEIPPFPTLSEKEEQLCQ